MVSSENIFKNYAVDLIELFNFHIILSLSDTVKKL